MRFLLYNIRYGAGSGWRVHFPMPFGGYIKPTGRNIRQIAAFIKSVNPDVTGLIEVDSGSFRSEWRSQAQTIAAELQQHHVFENKYGGASVARRLPLLNKQGNAFLTNQEISGLKFHYLNNGFKRLVIEAELKDFTTFLVHLSLKYRHRQDQLRDLYGLVQSARKPVIVAGDFNVFRGPKELSLFMGATGLLSANTGGEPSHPSRLPKRQLDFILHSPDIRATRFEAPIVRFSDHIPLIWDFEVQSSGRLARAA
ncbi:MAG: endonuclease/exonuclease/phosphatase family protein [Desulfosarcina sp.]|nr:endonuclease/exonuclease/phosphatase family protein [Desulfobacterales bacterium]